MLIITPALTRLCRVRAADLRALGEIHISYEYGAFGIQILRLERSLSGRYPPVPQDRMLDAASSSTMPRVHPKRSFGSRKAYRRNAYSRRSRQRTDLMKYLRRAWESRQCFIRTANSLGCKTDPGRLCKDALSAPALQDGLPDRAGSGRSEDRRQIKLYLLVGKYGIIDYDYSGWAGRSHDPQQAASALWKYLIYRGISPTIEIDVEIKDLDSISENCRAAVEGLAVVGALSLDSKSNVNPTRTMSRAEAAAMLMRACEVTPLRRSAG